MRRPNTLYKNSIIIVEIKKVFFASKYVRSAAHLLGVNDVINLADVDAQAPQVSGLEVFRLHLPEVDLLRVQVLVVRRVVIRISQIKPALLGANGDHLRWRRRSLSSLTKLSQNFQPKDARHF